MRDYRQLLMGVGLAALALASQTAVALADTPAPSSSASGQDQGSAIALPDLVVTAERREENLQSVPITVSAASAETLAKANVTTAADLSKMTPGLQMTTAAGSTVLTFLRGIGDNISLVGDEPDVPLYIDGIYYPRVTVAMFRLNNVERVETLYGPQGTLFGRNASGGVIQIITHDPVPGAPLIAKVSAGYSSFNATDISGYVSGSLTSNVAADLAVAFHDQTGGWGRNLFDGSPTSTDEDILVRSKFVAQLNPDTRIKFSFNYEHDEGLAGEAAQFFGMPQGYLDGSGRLPFIGFYDARNDTPTDAFADNTGGYFKIEHDFPHAVLSDTVAYNDAWEKNFTDADYSGKTLETVVLPTDARSLSNELQLTSRDLQHIQYTLGFYYLDQNFAFNNAVIRLPGAALVINSADDLASYAFYGQTTVDVTQALKLTLGGRYSVDDMTGHGSFNGFALAPGKNHFSNFSYKGVVSYDFAPHVMAYASVSSGYKSATYNLVPFSSAVVLPETLTAYEVGVKSELFDRRMRLDASAYYYDLKNPQVELQLAPGRTALQNAKAAVSKGFDLLSEFDITPSLSGHFGASYVDARYTDYNNAPLIAPNPNPPYGAFPAVASNAAGNHLPNSPPVTLNAGLDYSVAESYGNWDFVINYYYNSGEYFYPDNQQHQPAYGVLDAQVSFAFPGKHFKIRVFGTNLTGTQYYTGAFEFGSPVGYVGTPGVPRTFGVRVDWSL